MRKRALLFISVICTLAVAQMAVAKQYPPAPQPADDEEEGVAAPPGSSSNTDGGRPRVVTESLPYTPYPAGLSWIPTPQPFRVPIPDRIYYPPKHYVRRCPYYPRGYYWGANWRFNVVGQGNLLFFGPYRYNPYLTAAKAQHDPKLRGQRRYAPPPGPEGQAMLLGASSMPPSSLPPKMAENDHSDAHSETESQVAVVRKAPDRKLAQSASSRRTAKQSDRD